MLPDMRQQEARMWHYSDAGGQKGPFSAEQMAALIRAGTVQPTTLVWTAGMPGWLPMARTPLAAQAAPPPIAPPLVAGGADGFVGAVQTCFNKYVTFAGRARRPEFWWFVLFGIGGGIAASIVDGMLFGPIVWRGEYGHVEAGGPVNGLFHLAVFLPSIAVGARRLHDIGRSGWWQLLWLVPIVGWVVLIVFYAKRGAAEPNRFGG